MKRRTRETVNVDLTPLIDVVFLLLIFFMTASVFKKDELALLLDLPQTDYGLSKSQNINENIIIEISNQQLALNGKITNLEQIISKLKTGTNRNIPVEIRAKESARYKRVIQVLEQLQKYQYKNVSLTTAHKLK